MSMRRFVWLMIFALLFTAEAEGAVNLAERLQRETNKCLAKSELKQYVPYLKDSLRETLRGNWKFIKDAYDEKAEWSEALSRTAVDAVGYTVTPLLVDGVLATSDSKFAVILKEAELGIFCWEAGKEYFSYLKGDTTHEEFSEAMWKIAEHHVEGASVKILGYMISSAGATIISPAVIIAGNFAIQRIHDWYEFEQWKNTVYIDDIRAVLGDDLIRDFTIANPETHASFADTPRKPNIAEPEEHYNIINMKTRKGIIALE